MYHPGDEFREAEPALWMLTAFRAERHAPAGENQWVQTEMMKLAESGNISDSIDAVLRLLRGFIHLSSMLVDYSAGVSGMSGEDIVAVCRRALEDKIKEHGGPRDVGEG
jgi:hypothetical protein